MFEYIYIYIYIYNLIDESNGFGLKTRIKRYEDVFVFCGHKQRREEKSFVDL